MSLNRRAVLSLAAALPSGVAFARFQFDLGRVWSVREVSPGHGDWVGQWRRRGAAPMFDARWTDRISGQSIRDVIEVERFDGDRLVLFRRGINGRYYGTLGPDGRTIRRGTASWYDRSTWWSADIED